MIRNLTRELPILLWYLYRSATLQYIFDLYRSIRLSFHNLFS